MSVGNNFVDLRISNAGLAGASEDSVWPAFTDIMTVILMIFLISLVTFLLRNSQLVDELQTTLIAKDQISQQALLSAAQNTDLQSELARVSDRILSLEVSLLNLRGDNSQLEDSLETRELKVAKLETEIALLSKLRDQLSSQNSKLLGQVDIGKLALIETETALNTTKNTLNEKISLLLADKAQLTLEQDNSKLALSESEQEKLTLSNKLVALTERLRLINETLESKTEQNADLSNQLEDSNVVNLGLSTSKEALQAQLEKLTRELEKLQSIYTARGEEVVELQLLADASTQKFKSLQEEYDSLDEQYRNLIRPARSPAGKFVVDVYLGKQGANNRYQLRLPNQNVAQAVSLDALHRVLAELKQTHQSKLYTKIRIDDKSGVGFNEAWQFTQSILSEYDYYHHDYSQSQSVTPQ